MSHDCIESIVKRVVENEVVAVENEVLEENENVVETSESEVVAVAPPPRKKARKRTEKTRKCEARCTLSKTLFAKVAQFMYKTRATCFTFNSN